MREIIYAVGAAVFFIKGINTMTDKAVEKCAEFRVFRVAFWGTLSAGCLLATIFSTSWVLKQIFDMWK